MIQNNNIPAGYKNSTVGIIPQEWEVKPVKDFGKVVTGNTPSTAEASNYGDEYMFVSPVDLSDDKKYIFRTEKMLSSKGYAVSRKMPKGAILYTCIGSTIGKIGIASCELTSNQQINAVICNDNNEYLYYALLFLTGRIKMLAGEQAVPIINKSDFERIKLAVPPIGEQRKIADILGVWDEAIEKQSRLIEQLEVRKRALMQRLLIGRTRLPGFTTPWQKRRMKDCFEHITDTSNGCEYLPMTISARLGLISQKDKFDRVIAGDSLKKYTHIQKGDFAYNKGNSNLYEMGCIYRLKEQDAVVPFVYICFRPKQNVIGEFYQHFFINHGLDRQLKRIITSGARGDGLLNVDKTDFFELEIVYPPIAEQKAIAEVLTVADNEIATHRKKLDALRLQKRGLMQQLLIGKTRVKI